jgi:hypothetical protein
MPRFKNHRFGSAAGTQKFKVHALPNYCSYLVVSRFDSAFFDVQHHDMREIKPTVGIAKLWNRIIARPDSREKSAVI